jgi:hypothetical protein
MIAPRVDWKKVISLAAPGMYRRTWLSEALIEIYQDRKYKKFPELYRQLDPVFFSRQKLSPFMWYNEVMGYCADRFPLISPDEFYSVDEDTHPFDYIPVQPQGFDAWNDPFESDSLALCLCVEPWFEYSSHYNDSNLKRHVSDYKIYPALPAQIADVFLPKKRPRAKAPRPPRGRTWRKPWGALTGLVQMAYGATGFDILDEYEFFDYGAHDWNVSEIRSLENQWQKAGPLHKAILELKAHIDNDATNANLGKMALALLEDRETLKQITQPVKQRTLAEVFDEKEK